MDWKQIADAVGRASPALGVLLGGPAGGMVGAAIAAALGVQVKDFFLPFPTGAQV